MARNAFHENKTGTIIRTRWSKFKPALTPNLTLILTCIHATLTGEVGSPKWKIYATLTGNIRKFKNVKKNWLIF